MALLPLTVTTREELRQIEEIQRSPCEPSKFLIILPALVLRCCCIDDTRPSDSTGEMIVAVLELPPSDVCVSDGLNLNVFQKPIQR